jgi:hypothetical protein
MERHLSIGVSTIVALMAAHRAAAGGEGPPEVYDQAAVARVDGYLREEETARPVAGCCRGKTGSAR